MLNVCLSLSPQAWQLEHPIQCQVLLDEVHELSRHLILILQVGAPGSRLEGGGHATLLIAVSHSGAEEEDSLGSVQQKLVQDGQALNQLRLLGPLTFSLLLLLNEERASSEAVLAVATASAFFCSASGCQSSVSGCH